MCPVRGPKCTYILVHRLHDGGNTYGILRVSLVLKLPSLREVWEKKARDLRKSPNYEVSILHISQNIGHGMGHVSIADVQDMPSMKCGVE